MSDATTSVWYWCCSCLLYIVSTMKSLLFWVQTEFENVLIERKWARIEKMGKPRIITDIAISTNLFWAEDQFFSPFYLNCSCVAQSCSKIIPWKFQTIFNILTQVMTWRFKHDHYFSCWGMGPFLSQCKGKLWNSPNTKN